MRNIILLDCEDSFTHLLADRLRSLPGIHTTIIPEKQAPATLPPGTDALILSPGPGLPREHPAAFRLLQACPPEILILGICLGYQIIGMAYGARLIQLPAPRHGRCMTIRLHSRLTALGCPPEIQAGLYHSWALAPSPEPPGLEFCAYDTEGVPMAVCHRQLPRYGLQFHPESILTPMGGLLLGCLLNAPPPSC